MPSRFAAAAAAIALVPVALGGCGAAAGTPPAAPAAPAVVVREIERSDDLVAVEAEFDVPAGSRVSLRSEGPDGGGVSVLATPSDRDAARARMTLVLIADQIDRPARDGREATSAWRLLYRLKSENGGSAGGPMTNVEGPRPPLKERLTVSLATGAVPSATPVEAFRFDDETYNLVVEPPK